MEKHYQLSVTSDTTEVNVKTIDPSEIARIIQLAGLPASPSLSSLSTPPISTLPAVASSSPDMSTVISSELPDIDDNDDEDEMPGIDRGYSSPVVSHDIDDVENSSCAICGSDSHSELNCPSMMSNDSIYNDMPDNIDEPIDELEEDVAEYDYGSQDVDDKGHPINPTDYEWQASKLPQRIVKGVMGDNPLVSELHAHLLKEYNDYLIEANIENEDGAMSPLSDPTKPEFDKNPLSGEDPVVDGSRSPLSRIKRQHAFK